jgi:hypothetical protein
MHKRRRRLRIVVINGAGKKDQVFDVLEAMAKVYPHQTLEEIAQERMAKING